ncbi:recombinase RecT [Streptomyces sp. NPDC059063]|uniref:recombinase RecT n=1 Tax=Streptomyces sp. NPDC059063 TaxID=3346712 RepID=UPI0036917748
MSTLKDRIRAARQPEPAAPAAADEHDQAPDAPAELADVRGHHEVEPAVSQTAMEWLARYRDAFEEALPAHVDGGAFFAAVRAALPDLVRCTPASTLQALLACARFGLIPDGVQAVIKREGCLAVFVPMYQGYIELMYRSGLVESVHVGLVHESDEWTFEPSALVPLDFVHKARPELPKEERGPVVLAYAFAWLRGGARSQVVVLSREDAEEIRDEYSEAYRRAEESGTRDSFWHTDFTAMWSKSAVRRLAKVVPTSAELRALGTAEDAGDAGQVQVLHTPDPEAALLLAEADAAAAAAEASQDPAPSKGSGRGRAQPKRVSRRERRERRRSAR